MSKEHEALKKELTLFDVYAICTGAMFSSGFFLLPGIAFARTGSSVVAAYLLAGLLVVPAMFAKAELATAMPRAGGTYFYLDRSFGPLIGTVGGLGTWMAMVLKTAFAFVGIGVYLSLVVQVDGMSLSMGLIALFLVLNLVGVREATVVQRFLVVVLLAIMGLFIVQGLWIALPQGEGRLPPEFMSSGVAGLMSTIGLVFVSYAGLTKVASVAEEVKDPDRNIPLGMILSLLTSMLVYSLGAFVLITMLEPGALARPDLTPVASAAERVFAWMPGSWGLYLVVLASFGAFASTGNAALLSASRYLLALGRDRRVPVALARLNRVGTPTWALVLSAAAVAAALLSLDVESVAKLASAFQLMVFSMENLSLIVMRESEIETYDPGYRVPLYPAMPIVGFVAPFFLIAEMGHLAILFSFGLVITGTLWYFAYAREAGGSAGAVFYVLARVVRLHRAAVRRMLAELEGELEKDGLDVELMAIIGERGLREQDPYDEVVARALVHEIPEGQTHGGTVAEVAGLVARSGKIPEDWLIEGMHEAEILRLPEQGITLHHLKISGLAQAQLVLTRNRAAEPDDPEHGNCGRIYLFSSDRDPGQHLRILTHLALRIEREGFRHNWLGAEDDQGLRETLLHRQRFLALQLEREGTAAEMIGRKVMELDLPDAALLAAVRRGAEVIFPRGDTQLKEGDWVTFVGPREVIGDLAAELEMPPIPLSGEIQLPRD